MTTAQLHYLDGTCETRPVEIRDGIATLPASSLPDGIDHIDFLPDYLTANAGDDGCMIVPSIVNNGLSALVEFRQREDMEFAFRRNTMFLYGCIRNGSGFAAIVTGMSFEYSLVVCVKNGVYATYPRFHLEGERPYEDIQVVFVPVSGKDATYVGLGAAYRRYQLERGFVRPLRERAAANPVLAKAIPSPEVRLRLAWKPAAPSPVEEQTVENEPPMHVALPFDKVEEILDEFHRQGIADAEFCLVGWNKSGHDGRFPDLLPVEPALGGEEALRRLIAKAKSYGYLMTGHTNLMDSYSIAKRFDRRLLLLKKDGTEELGGSWGGGRSHFLCPKAAYEQLATDDVALLKDLGFQGLHYLDVFSILPTQPCHSPEHPLNRREAAVYRGKILQLAQEGIGGTGSEGAYDFVANRLDYVLYVYFSLKAKLPAICDRAIPLWMIVYHGILQYNSACDCVNACVKSDPKLVLQNVEWGGKPLCYFYSAFTTDAWMGKEDLVNDSPDHLAEQVAKIKACVDDYHHALGLQFEFITDHRPLAEGVMLTGYSNGQETVVNYTDAPFSYKGKTVPPLSWLLF